MPAIVHASEPSQESPAALIPAPSADACPLTAPEPASATPTALPGTVGADAAPTGTMQEIVEAIRANVELAARAGGAQARIALQPESLGGIRVHLSQTADGLLARLMPETAAAARALVQGQAELHRSLSSLGLPLRMALGAHAGSGAGAGTSDRERLAGGAQDRQGDGSARSPEVEEQELLAGGLADEGIEVTQAAVPTMAAALIDVLA
ncbi:MAG TPA: flagellar hook-length control protein FliK [Solirubrobacteraceae bacterium]|nr:flagellar hook-length control protein FliK [Solirubrobacteraceae bacterium]